MILFSTSKSLFGIKNEIFPFLSCSGDKEFSTGLAYTAVSRAKEFEKIAFVPTTPPIERFTRHFNHQIFKQRLKEDKRLENLETATIKKTNIEDIQTDDSDDDEVMDEILRDMEMIDNDIDISYDEANSDLE